VVVPAVVAVASGWAIDVKGSAVLSTLVGSGWR
jgi:hypothetical protein